MATYRNESGGVRILPDGTEVAKGETVDLSDKALENAGVKMWMVSGDLVAVEKPKKSDK